jgi:endonuclease-8
MPEGDTVAGHAELLRPVLLGKTITEVAGTARSVRANSHRILDGAVTGVRTVGKNLIVDLDTGYSIRVHLGMPGYWRVGRDLRSFHGSARLVLGTESGMAVCYSAPTVDVDRTPVVAAFVSRLGPDLLAGFDESEFVRRARAHGARTIAEVLLDQRVLAGIGNVYKSEVLFLEGIHPSTPVGELDDERLREISTRAGRLLAANVGQKSRSTTGSRSRGHETWVYGRAGRPCRKCGQAVARRSDGERTTFWCPTCQPPLSRRPDAD